MSLKYFLCGFLVLAGACGSTNAAPQSNHTPAASQTAAQKTTKQSAAKQDSVHNDDGERIFEQNCNRCHNVPEGFSPRITGTIVRHMRMRASLSKHDEEALLHFFNP